jgi:hypothetical protein
MGCNTSRSECTIDSVFAAVANPNCGQLFNPSNLMGEQLVYDMAFKDLINNFGIPVNYYIHSFSLSACDTFYGSQPTAVFYGPVPLMMYIELTDGAIKLSKYGFAPDDEFTGFVHIQTFEDEIANRDFYIRTQTGVLSSYNEYRSYVQSQSATPGFDFPANIDSLTLETGGYDFNTTRYSAQDVYTSTGQSVEPKSGDLIEVWPLGCDRPNGRGAKIYEVTERTDQDIATLNPVLGHYVYRLRAKRFMYSFEPGAPLEKQNQQVFDNGFSGIISSTIPGVSASPAKTYPGNINTISKDEVFDMSANNTDIYGEYY